MSKSSAQRRTHFSLTIRSRGLKDLYGRGNFMRISIGTNNLLGEEESYLSEANIWDSVEVVKK